MLLSLWEQKLWAWALVECPQELLPWYDSVDVDASFKLYFCINFFVHCLDNVAWCTSSGPGIGSDTAGGESLDFLLFTSSVPLGVSVFLSRNDRHPWVPFHPFTIPWSSPSPPTLNRNFYTNNPLCLILIILPDDFSVSSNQHPLLSSPLPISWYKILTLLQQSQQLK